MDPEQFEILIKQNRRALSSPEAKQRRDAARWLGEAGVLESTTQLAQLYKNDPDKGVRKEAEYSLGMFRAIQEALDRDEAVNLDGTIGNRVGSMAGLRALQFILVLTFVVMLALGFVLGGSDEGGGTEPEPTSVAIANQAPRGDPDTIIAEVDSILTLIANDANTLKAQFQAIADGGEPNCTAFFNDPPAYLLAVEDAAAFPVLAEAVTEANAIQTSLVELKQSYMRHCDGLVLLAPNTVEQPIASLDTILADMPKVQNLLATGRPTATAEAPTATATLAESATPEPTATSPTSDIAGHIGAMFNIIDRMTGIRGPLTVATQTWTEVLRAGATDGCDLLISAESIPAGYELSTIDLRASIELGRAASNLNGALQQLTATWTRLQTACSNGDLQSEAEAGLGEAVAAERLFGEAQRFLNELRFGTS